MSLMSSSFDSAELAAHFTFTRYARTLTLGFTGTRRETSIKNLYLYTSNESYQRREEGSPGCERESRVWRCQRLPRGGKPKTLFAVARHSRLRHTFTLETAGYRLPRTRPFTHTPAESFGRATYKSRDQELEPVAELSRRRR